MEMVIKVETFKICYKDLQFLILQTTGMTWLKVAEVLFKEDLDRSQKFANRTRRCIIFDKWVVPRLTNPSIKEF